MKKDVITEMLTGHKGAFKTIGKLVTVENEGNTVVLGLIIGDINEPKEYDEHNLMKGLDKSMQYQLWEGEFIFMPRTVYQGRKENHEQFVDLDAQQILSSNWGDVKAWLNKIFDNP